MDRLKQSMNENISLIEKERNARSQMIGVLEQFVVGSQDVRQNLAQAARGVQFAYGTGTLQNQTPEQRQATVGLLDQLSDVNIAGAFRSAITGQIKEGTGQNIKQELVFRDAIRMGLDPEIAKQLATATSKEEKLIQANENLAAQINNLAGVMAAAAVAIAAPPAPAAAAPPAAQKGGVFASGGLVQYRADGGSIFKPKGTDTVPAMLTPGEFVIRKSAVDKVGVGALQAINNGGDAVGLAKGGPVYLSNGSRRKLSPLDEARVAKGELDTNQESYVQSMINALSGDPYASSGSVSRYSRRRDDAIKAAKDSSTFAGVDAFQDSISDSKLITNPLTFCCGTCIYRCWSRGCWW